MPLTQFRASLPTCSTDWHKWSKDSTNYKPSARPWNYSATVCNGCEERKNTGRQPHTISFANYKKIYSSYFHRQAHSSGQNRSKCYSLPCRWGRNISVLNLAPKLEMQSMLWLKNTGPSYSAGLLRRRELQANCSNKQPRFSSCCPRRKTRHLLLNCWSISGWRSETINFSSISRELSSNLPASLLKNL